MNVYDDDTWRRFRELQADYRNRVEAEQEQQRQEDAQQQRFNDAMNTAFAVGATVGIGGIALVLFIFYILPDLPFWFLPIILTGVGAGFVTFQHTYNEKDESPDD